MKDDGKGGRIRDRAKMRLDAGLHRLVVIRHDRKHRVGARRLGMPRQFDGLTGRIRSRPCDDPNAATRGFDGGADDAVVLGRRQRCGLAGGFADHDRRDARLDLPFAKPGQCRQIMRPSSSNGVGRSAMCPRARWRELQLRSSDFTPRFPFRRSPADKAESTRPCWHLTPASIRKPICCSLVRIFRLEPLSRKLIRTAIAALAAEILRYPGEGRFNGEQRALTGDQADSVLPPADSGMPRWWPRE